MSKMKKLLAMILALAMVLGMSMTTFAAPTTNTNAIKVLGVESEQGVKVNAYQIIEYDAVGSYKEVLAGTITKNGTQLSPTADDVAKLALRTSDLGTPVELAKAAGTDYYTGTLSAGTWMIIVTGSSSYLYNPAIISVQQGPNGLVYGELNLATDTWADRLYVKKSQPKVEKVAEEVTADDAVNGVQYGDKVKYTITVDIPSYTPEVAKTATLTITDTLVDAKLVDVNKATVAIAGATPEDVAAIQTLFNNALKEDGTTFTITIKGKEWLAANAGKKVVLTYWAKVTAAAEKVDELTNTVTYVYSGNHTLITKTDSTRHYTFSIDGEFKKVNKEKAALKDAEFQLHIGSEKGELYVDANGKNTFKTDDNGKLVIRGLDCDTVYYLVETKAPTGYTIDATPVKVEFKATFNNDGIYASHVVKINGNEVNGAPYEFVNTTLVALPSTGGIGTTVFTIAGCGIMIAAAYLFFASRRREEA